MTRTALVTDISEAELRELQAETAVVLKRKFHEAKPPCFMIVNETETLPVVFDVADASPNYRVKPIRGRTYGYVYNQDPTREAQAHQQGQPSAGEQPRHPVPNLLRMTDGSLVFFDEKVHSVIAEPGSLTEGMKVGG